MSWCKCFSGYAAWLALIAATSASGADTPDIVRVLRNWEQATADDARSTAEPDWQTYSRTHSVHELAAARALCGPVSARTLIEQYEWSAVANPDGTIVLTAAPRDTLVRLFFNAVDIEIDPTSACPKSLTFRDSHQRARAVAIVIPAAAGVRRAEATGNAGRVQLAALTEAVDAEAADAAPGLSEVLAQWSATTESIERAELTFVRYACDLIAGTEERSSGRLYFEQPGRGVYELRPAALTSDARSERTAQNGQTLIVTTGQARLYLWDNNRLCIARPDDKQYEEFRILKQNDIQLAGSQNRGWKALTAPQRTLPATVDVHSDRFLEQFEWSLLQSDNQRLILQGRSLAEADQPEISELQVILDPATHRALATRLISGNRERETVHVLKWVAVNDEVSHRDWQPDLTGYEACQPAPEAPPAEAPGLLPAAE